MKIQSENTLYKPVSFIKVLVVFSYTITVCGMDLSKEFDKRFGEKVGLKIAWKTVTRLGGKPSGAKRPYYFLQAK